MWIICVCSNFQNCIQDYHSTVIQGIISTQENQSNHVGFIKVHSDSSSCSSSPILLFIFYSSESARLFWMLPAYVVLSGFFFLYPCSVKPLPHFPMHETLKIDFLCSILFTFGFPVLSLCFEHGWFSCLCYFVVFDLRSLGALLHHKNLHPLRNCLISWICPKGYASFSSHETHSHSSFLLCTLP